jgi:hypothetical protein
MKEYEGKILQYEESDLQKARERGRETYFHGPKFALSHLVISHDGRILKNRFGPTTKELTEPKPVVSKWRSFIKYLFGN